MFTWLVVVLWAAGCLFAQNETGTITGLVIDTTGGAVGGAAVTVLNPRTGFERVFKTNADGTYSVPFLPPGQYDVTVEKEGFRTESRIAIPIEVQHTVRADFVLSVGGVKQTVEVKANAIQLEAENPTVGEDVNSRQVVDLPLNGRNFIDLVYLGAAIGTTGDGGSVMTNGLLISIQGARTTSNQFMVEGEPINDTYSQTPAYSPSVDAIQEFKEQTQTYSAEFGGSANQVNMSFKSGTNGLHGSAFEFLRNNDVDARGFFDTKAPPPLRQNQFGYSLGGPIYIPKVYDGRNRSFFFANYEGWRIRASSTGFVTVPTTQELAGTFTTPVIDPLTNLPFSGNQIPKSRFSNLALATIPTIPSPNINVPQGNYIYVAGSTTNYDQQNYKFDQNIGNHDSMFFRFSKADYTTTADGVTPILNTSADLPTTNYQASETHTFSPNIVNELRIGWIHTQSNTLGHPTTVSAIQGLGLSGVYDPTKVASNFLLFPVMEDTSTGIFLGGGANAVPNLYHQPAWDLSEALAIVKGKHSIKVGYQMRRMSHYFDDTYQLYGIYDFIGLFTGNAVGDFLLGNAYTAQASLPTAYASNPAAPGSPYTIYYNTLAPYVNDSWKVSRTLTLDLGLRYDYSGLPYEQHNHWAWRNVNAPGGGVCVADDSLITSGVGGTLYQYCHSRTAGTPQKKVFAPRIGMAWQPFGNKKTVLRGGYGVFFDSDPAHEDYATGKIYPYTFIYTLDWTAGMPLIYTDDLFPSVSGLQPITTANFGAFEDQSPQKKDPYVQDWSLSIQRQLGPRTVAEIFYVGSKGTHLDGRTNPNQAWAPNPNNLTPVASRIPYPNLGLLIENDWNFNSNYNSLNLKLEHRAGDLNLLAVYTWSAALDDKSGASSVGGENAAWAAPMDSHDYALDYGRSGYDAKQRLVTSFIYDLPFGRGKKFLPTLSKAADFALGGWQVNGIVLFQGGLPFTLSATDAGGYLDTYGQRPNLVGNPYPSGFSKSVSGWFNTKAFAQPAPGLFGTAGRDILRCPGTNNWNLSIFKNFPITERVRWQLRFEGFNTFNHPQFGQPDSGVNDPTFGVISGLAQSARIIQFGTKIIW
jgi:hypothetical protein